MFLQFNIEPFNMRPRRTIQHSTFSTQHSHCRPSRNSNLLPRLVVVGVALLAILADRKQPKTKKYLIMIFLLYFIFTNLHGMADIGQFCAPEGFHVTIPWGEG